jgi:RNA polymerase-binding protein DksA
MSTTIQPLSGDKFNAFEEQLTCRRDELRVRLDEHRRGVFVEFELDDEIAAACESRRKDFLIGTLERERQTLAEIELALTRMKKGDYGVCAACGKTIPETRLHALPWARCCVQCAARGSSSRVMD